MPNPFRFITFYNLTFLLTLTWRSEGTGVMLWFGGLMNPTFLMQFIHSLLQV
jgi:hypothetical protein